MLITSTGLGMLFVPLSLVALTRVRGEDSGIASSLLNTGQQVGGAIGLAALGTVTWTAVANNIKHQAAVAAGHAGQALPAGRSADAVPAVMLHHALAAGISRGFLIAAGIAVLAFLVVRVTIRARRRSGSREQLNVEPGSQLRIVRAEAVIRGLHKRDLLRGHDPIRNASARPARLLTPSLAYACCR